MQEAGRARLTLAMAEPDAAAEAKPADVLEGLLLPAEVTELHPDDDQVAVRLNGKGNGAEGLVPLGDFRVAQSDPPKVAVGDAIEVHVEQRSSDGRRWVASKDKAMRLRAFRTVQETFRNGAKIEGEVVGTMEGGYSVDIGIRAFLPASQVGMRPVRRSEEVLGQHFTFKIIRFDKSRQNVVVSRRVLLEVERDARLERLKKGALVEGAVKSFTDYGAFVDIGAGVEGLLHIEEMSWNRLRRPQEAVKLGDKITCKVILVDQDKKRISLSLRQIQDDPWAKVTEKYTVGTVVSGLVVSKTDFGAFLELEPGLEGLVHSTGALVAPGDSATLRRVDIGDELSGRVVDIDRDRRRLSLVLAGKDAES